MQADRYEFYARAFGERVFYPQIGCNDVWCGYCPEYRSYISTGCNGYSNDPCNDPCTEDKNIYEGENETYIEASVENSSSILYDKEIRNKPLTRRTKRNV